MNYAKITAIATSFIALSSFLGVFIALIYYTVQIRSFIILEIILGVIIYIDVNLLFYYFLKRKKII